MSGRQWRPTDIPGYLVSDDGLVWSEKTQKLIPQHLHRRFRGYAQVKLGPSNRYVHSLILTAFVGPRPANHVARHLDGNPKNNTLTNLRWGTHSENIKDQVAHGRHRNAVKQTCPKGHAYDEGNVYLGTRANGSTFRQCRECLRAKKRRYREQKRSVQERAA